MSRLSFNKAPYYDDFKSSNNYMKILFRNGRSIQTRELNQIQSIFQNQIEQFANHIFKNKSRVSNARSSLVLMDYVLIDNLSVWKKDIKHPYGKIFDNNYIYEGITIRGEESRVEARLSHFEPAKFIPFIPIKIITNSNFFQQ